jgi:calmodulin
MMRTITSEKDLQDAFKVFDPKGEKSIGFEGLKAVLAEMGEKMTDDDIMNMIKEADEDGDGRVSFDEFKKLMMR